ncbi:hypothetical protein NMG29_32905 [Streptomyces cocklensis]|uniref:PH domain-containing protein n=1 Tax=Actinacidiphila cocklensis TaxID=887465 RepID=A0A9W4E7X4_9ACTN|nr:hypothetical protein [Actinacidiphila cocklensis]MDD1062943.1 hypothetical protein [Actinacidiphila cocklensis]CAG6394868.1 conserved hypothetical protein [Actinacidiphila cocklensis]
MREQGGDAVVWRVHPRLMVWAGVFWALAVLAGLSAWLAWSVDRTDGKAVQAAVGTALVAAVTLAWGLVLLRPRVELRGETVVIVNPLATHRLRREEIVAVTDGLHGAAVFHRNDGFKTRAVALGEASACIRDERLSEFRRVLGL